MTNKKSFLHISVLLFSVVLLMLLVKVMIGAEVRQMNEMSYERTMRQFVDTRAYKKGENPFPKSAYFYTPKGEKVAVESYQGHYILLNLWATWCPGCVKELPSLQRLAYRFKNEDYPVVVIALSLDREKDQAQLANFLVKYDIGPFALYHDRDKKISRAYPVSGMPTTLLIDPEGNVIYEFLGEANWEDYELVNFLYEVVEPFKMVKDIKKSL